MCPSTVSKCEVCDQEPFKYKCPKCLLKYCSVACFKSHKDAASKVFCAGRATQQTLPEVSVTEPMPHQAHQFESEDKVPEHLLKKLGECTALKDQLQNPRLRDVLKTLDHSQNPGDDIAKLMKEPMFVEFVDECLKVVGPKLEEK